MSAITTASAIIPHFDLSIIIDYLPHSGLVCTMNKQWVSYKIIHGIFTILVRDIDVPDDVELDEYFISTENFITIKAIEKYMGEVDYVYEFPDQHNTINDIFA